MTAFQAARLVAGTAPPALSLQEAYVAVVHTKHVGQLVKCLTNDLPLGPLQHLKRVRKSAGGQNLAEVLLCLAGQQQQQPPDAAANSAAGKQQQSPPPPQQQQQSLPLPPDAAAVNGGGGAQQQQQQQLQFLPPRTAQLLQQLAAHVTTCQVPVSQPANKDAWQQWCELWPMPWRKVAEDIQLDGQAPAPAEQRHFEHCMAEALAAAAAAGGRNAALIVDPASGSVVGRGLDCSCQHPLDHAAMVAVEAVAARDRRLWPYNGFAHVGRHQASPDAAGYTAVAPASHLSPAAAGGDGGSEDSSRPCKKQKPLGDSSSHSAQQAAAGTPTPAVAAAAAADGSSSGGMDWASKPYLCTGFDCFLVREPCTMCAMALVHSRLARVVYCHPDATHGALGGRFRLHAQRSLNHHYKVYHLPLQDSGDAAADELTTPH